MALSFVIILLIGQLDSPVVPRGLLSPALGHDHAWML
jgi:hypothetical protein